MEDVSAIYIRPGDVGDWTLTAWRPRPDGSERYELTLRVDYRGEVPRLSTVVSHVGREPTELRLGGFVVYRVGGRTVEVSVRGGNVLTGEYVIRVSGRPEREMPIGRVVGTPVVGTRDTPTAPRPNPDVARDFYASSGVDHSSAVLGRGRGGSARVHPDGRGRVVKHGGRRKPSAGGRKHR